MPKVSVIIPSYNSERYISQAIQSVLNQTHQDFEIVVTDDGSTDRTVSEVERFDDPRIVLYTFDKNRGVASATNNSIKNSSGQYIAILDSDNVFLPTKLETQIQFLTENSEIGAVFTYARLIDDKSEELQNTTHPYYTLFEQSNRTRHEWLNYFFYKNNCLCHPSAMIRKECYDTVGYYNRRLSQLLDLDLWTRLCMQYGIFIIPEKLVKFRIRDDGSNLSGQSLEAQARHDWQASQILNNYLTIVSTQELSKIFPEVSRFGEQLDDDLIPYYLSMLVFEGNYAPAKLWALNTLYGLLDTPASTKLREIAGFEEIDFIQLTSDPDVFDLERRVRQQEQLSHQQEQLSHQHTHLIQQQRRRIETIENSWSWKLTRPLRRVWRSGITGLNQRIRRLSHRLSGNKGSLQILLECDRVTYSSTSLDVSGWALSDRGIERVEVHFNGMFAGNAIYGIARPDVQEAYSWMAGSEKAGFHLNVNLSLTLPPKTGPS